MTIQHADPEFEAAVAYARAHPAPGTWRSKHLTVEDTRDREILAAIASLESDGPAHTYHH
jgi:hypothetical protein